MESLSRGFKGLVAFNHPLAPHTSYGVGGPARIYAEPADLEEMLRSLSFAEKEGLALFVIGKGSNLLVSDRGFPGMVLNLSRCCGKLEKEGKRISVGAGYSLDDLTAFCARESLGGIEMLAGIPGTLGGALRMNAGAFDGAIYDRVLTVQVLKDNLPVVIPKESLRIGYRKVPELEGRIILGCTLELEEASGITEKRLDILARRASKQPLDFPSCGSVFKRPPGHFVGNLIETAGCKGMVLGGAKVSEKHANFILNVDEARAADIHGLINKVKEMVLAAHGVVLETEVIFLGF